MEGDPFFEASGGLEFLFGVICRERRRLEPTTPRFAPTIATRRSDAFEQFIDLVVERRRRYPDMHVYHYAVYEPVTLARLMGRYATRELEVDDLLRDEVLVDLYKVVGQGLRAGVPSLLAEGDRAVLLHARGRRQVGERRRADVRGSTSRAATSSCWSRSRPTTRRTASRRSSFATGWSSSATMPRQEYAVDVPWRLPPEAARADTGGGRGPRRDARRCARRSWMVRSRARSGGLPAQLLDYHAREDRPRAGGGTSGGWR